MKRCLRDIPSRMFLRWGQGGSIFSGVEGMARGCGRARSLLRDAGNHWAAWATASAMSWSMRVKASSRESSPAMTWLVRVTSAP